MLAALIATRGPAPPPPVVFFYTNQFIAATNTFACINICRRAAALTTSQTVQYQLYFSLPGNQISGYQYNGQESLFWQLSRAYARLLTPQAFNGSVFLSTNIAQVISIATALQVVLATLPIQPFATSQQVPMLAPTDSQFGGSVTRDPAQLPPLQRALAVALVNLQALGTPVN